MGTFLQQWQSWVVVIEIVQILKPKILPIWLFKKNFANLWSVQWLITSSGILITFKLFFLVSSCRVGTGTNILSWLVRDIKSPKIRAFLSAGLKESITSDGLFLHKAKKAILNMCQLVYPSFKNSTETISRPKCWFIDCGNSWAHVYLVMTIKLLK